jgi:putative FmdB family regulatory protein
MPIYEYECAKCGHIMEAIQKISDAALTKCPACHKRSLRKRVTAAAFHLKGTGWYATDFKDKAKVKKDDKDKATDTPATKESAKSDTPATETKKSEPSKKSETAATK